MFNTVSASEAHVVRVGARVGDPTVRSISDAPVRRRISQTIGGQIRLFATSNTVSASEAPAVRVGARVGARSS